MAEHVSKERAAFLRLWSTWYEVDLAIRQVQVSSVSNLSARLEELEKNRAVLWDEMQAYHKRESSRGG